MSSRAPHWAQNFEPAALTWPHAAHASAWGAPHCGQKRASAAMAAWQHAQALVVAMAYYSAPLPAGHLRAGVRRATSRPGRTIRHGTQPGLGGGYATQGYYFMRGPRIG